MSNRKFKKNMEPGKRYRGYGFINEYNEFCFEPENTGSRAGLVKQITVRDGVSLSHTRDNLLIHIKVQKSHDVVTLLRNVMSKFNIIGKLIQEYDF